MCKILKIMFILETTYKSGRIGAGKNSESLYSQC